jgi:hypothetical protein
VVKIKKDLIHKAKVKKSYAKLKAQMPIKDVPLPAGTSFSEDHPTTEASQALHPDRQAMLDDPRGNTPPLVSDSQPQHTQRRRTRPKYFEKEQEFAERKKEEGEARRAEIERQNTERRQKIKERERLRKAMAKARSGGKNGQRKLGRESQMLLERVKKMVRE